MKDDFAAALDKFVEIAKKKGTERLRRAGTEAVKRIVVRTPVDSGCCRGNWRVAFGALDRTFDPNLLDKSGGKTISACSARIKAAELGNDVFISNSTPYVEPLEYGFSRQRPEGMVRVTAEDIRGLLERGAFER